MLKTIITIVISGIMIMGNCACGQNGGAISMENKTTYTEDDFVNLRSGTSYDEVIEKYGETDDGWGNPIYLLEDGNTLRVSISMNKQVLFVETRQGNEFMHCLKWEEREKSENDGKSSTRHKKSDFTKIKEGMSFDEVEGELGLDYSLIGNGFIIAKYLTEDFEWVVIACGQNNEVKSISFTPANISDSDANLL